MQTNFVHDLAGISRATGETLFPESFLVEYPTADENRLRDAWNAESSDPITFGVWVMPTGNAKVVSDLRRAWLGAVVHHPLTWLGMRGRMMRALLGIGGPVRYPYHRDEWRDADAAVAKNQPLGVTWSRSRVHALLVAALDGGLANSFCFRGWLYLLAAIALAIFGARSRRLDAISIAMIASLLLYVAPLFLIAPAPDFRYLYWPLLATLLVAASIFTASRPTPDRRPPSDPATSTEASSPT
jgi:hypothetical protein